MSKAGYEAAYKAAQEKDTVARLDLKMVQWGDPGSVLIGEFVSQEDMTSEKFEGTVQRYVFKTDAGLMSCLLGSATDKQIEGRMQPGDLMRIEFEGQKDIGSGKTVNLFKIEKFGHADKGPKTGKGD